MEVKAWIQMGCERREVTFRLSAREIAKVGQDKLETYIEDLVLDWISSRYGWGWSCGRFVNDFSFLEDDQSTGSSYPLTDSHLNPATVRLLVNPRMARRTDRGLAMS